MNGGRHLAAGTRHAAIGDECDLVAAVLQHRQGGGKLVQFRHAVGGRSLKAHHDNHVTVELARAEGGQHVFLMVEHGGRGLDGPALGGDGAGLVDAAPQIAFHHLHAAIGAEGIGGRAQDALIGGGASFFPYHPVLTQFGLLAVFGKAATGHGQDIGVQQAGIKQRADQAGHAAHVVEGVHIFRPVGIDAGKLRHDGGKLVEVGPVDDDACRPRHGGNVDGKVGRSTRGQQAHGGVDNGAFINTQAQRAVVLAARADLAQAVDGGTCQFLPQLRVGWHEG
ncbi:hypothetical protein KOXY103107_12680 [Komagataeibacter xylinus]